MPWDIPGYAMAIPDNPEEGSREPVCTEWPRLVLGYWGGEHSTPRLQSKCLASVPSRLPAKTCYNSVFKHQFHGGAMPPDPPRNGRYAWPYLAIVLRDYISSMSALACWVQEL